MRINKFYAKSLLSRHFLEWPKLRSQTFSNDRLNLNTMMMMIPYGHSRLWSGTTVSLWSFNSMSYFNSIGFHNINR
jgi:hypothetical protein